MRSFDGNHPPRVKRHLVATKTSQYFRTTKFQPYLIGFYHDKMKCACITILTFSVFCGTIAADFVAAPLTTLTSVRGHHSTDQALEVLAFQEQNGADNDWATYVEISAQKRGYRGIFDYHVPSNVDVTDVESLQVDINFLGANANWAQWNWRLFNFELGTWVSLGNNQGSSWSTWHMIRFEPSGVPSSYIGNNGLIRLRLDTSKSNEVCDLDLQRITLGIKSQPSNEIWVPPPETTWQWQISGTVDTSLDVEMYDIDLFDTPQQTIDDLHAAGKIVICYFSAGSYEDWREDATSFASSLLGNPLGDWDGEWWLDIRQISGGIGPVMQNRMDLAVAKNCDGVEPDNIDAYQNNNGLGLTSDDQLAYNKWLANQAHARGLSIGLKNDLDQVVDLVDDFDWALNEQCWEYDECDLLLPFISAGKAVFGVEYNGNPSSFCPSLNAMKFSWLKKTWDLNAWVQECRFY